MSLEEKITKGKVSYIHSFNYDGIKDQMQINLLYNPENPSFINLMLTFYNVSDLYIEQIEKEDEDYLQQIIGIDEYKEENTVKYVIQTDIKTIIFKTETEPLIKETK
jgi:hypothetical protein